MEFVLFLFVDEVAIRLRHRSRTTVLFVMILQSRDSLKVDFYFWFPRPALSASMSLLIHPDRRAIRALSCPFLVVLFLIPSFWSNQLYWSSTAVLFSVLNHETSQLKELWSQGREQERLCLVQQSLESVKRGSTDHLAVFAETSSSLTTCFTDALTSRKRNGTYEGVTSKYVTVVSVYSGGKQPSS